MQNRMLVQFLCVIGLLIVTSIPGFAQSTQPPKAAASSVESSRIDAEVRQMLSQYFEAVERHELSNFLAFFAEGEDLTVIEDQEMYDWRSFMVFAEGFFQQVAEITFDLEKCTVNSLSPSIAVATGVFRGTGKISSGEPMEVHNAFTFVLLKEGDRWLIKHVHESSL